MDHRCEAAGDEGETAEPDDRGTEAGGPIYEQDVRWEQIGPSPTQNPGVTQTFPRRPLTGHLATHHRSNFAYCHRSQLHLLTGQISKGSKIPVP